MASDVPAPVEVVTGPASDDWRASVPPLTVVVPVNELMPERASVPAPVFVRASVPVELVINPE